MPETEQLTTTQMWLEEAIERAFRRYGNHESLTPKMLATLVFENLRVLNQLFSQLGVLK